MNTKGKLQLRRDTLKKWEQRNPVLENGEVGLIIKDEKGLPDLKIGDGITSFRELETFSLQNLVSSKNIKNIFPLTQSEYDALTEKRDDTMYIIITDENMKTK